LPTIPKDVEEMLKEEAERSGVTVEELLVEIISRALNKPPSLKPIGGRLLKALREFREEVLLKPRIRYQATTPLTLEALLARTPLENLWLRELPRVVAEPP